MNRIVFLTLTLTLPATLSLAVPITEAATPRLPDPSAPRRAETPKQDHLPMPPVSRGQMLYENHCMGCHESVLFIRERRDVKTLPDLRKEVARWAVEAKAPWRDEEIGEVTRYLNQTYYRLPEQ